MGRNAWESAAEANFRSSGSTRWGRVLFGIIVVAAATFVFAYYVPLHRSHEALMRKQQESSQATQTLEQKLRDAEQQLGTTKKKNEELETERSAREKSQKSASDKLGDVKAAVLAKLDRQIKKGGAAVDAAGSRVVAAFETRLLFASAKPEVSNQGKGLLCDVAKGAPSPSQSLRVSVSSEAGAPGGGSVWELTAAQAAALADTLEQKCGVSARRLSATGHGASRAPSALTAVEKLGANRVEIEIAVEDAAR
jgi:chemotaxis protein MotB